MWTAFPGGHAELRTTPCTRSNRAGKRGAPGAHWSRRPVSSLAGYRALFYPCDAPRRLCRGRRTTDDGHFSAYYKALWVGKGWSADVSLPGAEADLERLTKPGSRHRS